MTCEISAEKKGGWAEPSPRSALGEAADVCFAPESGQCQPPVFVRFVLGNPLRDRAPTGHVGSPASSLRQSRSPVINASANTRPTRSKRRPQRGRANGRAE